MDPIKASELAERAQVAVGSVTNFWKRRFGTESHKGTQKDYRHACLKDTLPLNLALWRGEFPSEEAVQLLTKNYRDEGSDE